jgi:hypothetical protein
MTPVIAFSRTPTSPPVLHALQIGKLLLNGIAESDADPAARQYSVRLSTDDDHPSIGDGRREALRQGFKCWARCITITRLCDGKRWIFAERSVSFQNGFEDTDEHARARLAANERAKLRLFGGAQ